MTELTVFPRDPLVARDGRPFNASSPGRARTLPFPLPSTVAGFVRSALGRASAHPQPFADPEYRARLLEVEVRGPLFVRDQECYVPAPLDAVWSKVDGKWRVEPALPVEPTVDGGVNLPVGLWPLLTEGVGKAQRGPEFWSLGRVERWLTNPETAVVEAPRGPTSLDRREDPPWPDGYARGPGREERTSVAIDPDTGRADEGRLYRVYGLAFGLNEGLALVVEAPDSELSQAVAGLSGLHPFGGERRLAEVVAGGSEGGWICPSSVQEALRGAEAIRLVLATPTCFAQGWLPGWLDRASGVLRGTVPGTAVEVELVAAAVGRWQPLSGWDLVRREPKSLRRMVPAGSVYFFRVVGGSPGELAQTWLSPVADDPQDRRDGFGLALWGVWSGRKGGRTA